MNVIQFLGQGVVAVNKNTNTYDIMVYLPGNAPETSGGVRANNTEVTSEGVDTTGNRVRVSSLRSNTVPATWRAMGEPNRVSAPDVREGTPVMIYTVGGTDKYYWTTWGMNLVTHKLETVMWGWSANPELTKDHEFDLKNYYTMSVSTHSGEMRIRTTDKNNEATTWDINLNAMAGFLSIVGGEESILNLNDVEHSLTYINKDGSSFCIDKEDMFIKLPKSFNLEAANKIEIYTQLMRLAIKDKLIVNCPETLWTGNITQVGDYNQKGSYNAEGSLTRMGSEKISGSVLAGGIASSAGASAIKVSVKINGDNIENSASGPSASVAAGNVSGTGSLTIDKGAVIKDDASIGGKSFLGHKHGNGNNGSPTTPPQ